MHLELDITDSGLSYLPGDAVGIYPNNRPSVCIFHEGIATEIAVCGLGCR